MDLQPYYDLVDKGVNPHKAWKQSREQIRERTVYGKWNADHFVAKVGSYGAESCTMATIR